MDDKKRQIKKEELIEIIEHYEKRIEYLMDRIQTCEDTISSMKKDIEMLRRWRG